MKAELKNDKGDILTIEVATRFRRYVTLAGGVDRKWIGNENESSAVIAEALQESYKHQKIL